MSIEKRPATGGELQAFSAPDYLREAQNSPPVAGR
jgi:hypothetical protein